MTDPSVPPDIPREYPAAERSYSTYGTGLPLPPDAGGPRYPTGEPVTTPQTLPGRNDAPRLRRFLRAPATYVLLGINIAVFLLMVLRGSSVQMPTEGALIHFGANNAELVLAYGQWWRIVTAMFVHVGLIHLGTNMWCLWNLGLLGEPLLGFSGMIAVYLLTGAAGNLLSTIWNVFNHDYSTVGAGASGAVFGIAGILIVLLSNRRLALPRSNGGGIPLAELHSLRRSVINFAGINLAIGLFSEFQSFLPIHIDNRAHVGGFVYGLALGVPLLPSMTLGRTRYLSRQRVTFAGGVLVLVLVGVWLSKLR